jgi:DNA processing protein
MTELWLRMTLTPGWGPRTIHTLLDHLGSAHAIAEANARCIEAIIGPERSRAWFCDQPMRSKAVDQAIAWQARDSLHHLISWSDPDYPPLLRTISDAPLLLYVHGQRPSLSRAMLGIVGARNATANGAVHARNFAHTLSNHSWVVVSGLARGIDAAAHQGALEGASNTVAVLGTGIDVVYPAAHTALASRLVHQGALVSEFPLGTGPASGNFPRRNRIIAGMAHGILVVEAAVRSGSLITAQLAADYGRDVFALPGSIDAPLARGCHELLRRGAKLVESAADILDEFAPLAPPVATVRPHIKTQSAPTDPLLTALGHDPVHPDILAAHLDWPTHELNARLVVLELTGELLRLPDGRVQRLSVVR